MTKCTYITHFRLESGGENLQQENENNSPTEYSGFKQGFGGYGLSYVEREDCSSRRDTAQEKQKKIGMKVLLQIISRKKSRNFIHFIRKKIHMFLCEWASFYITSLF